MKKLRFGVLGCSRIAETSVIPAIINSGLSELGIIGSRSQKKAYEFAEKFSCSKSGTYEDVLNSDVDAIYVSLPVGLHEEWAIKAAKAGKHILCEKSSTTSYKSACRMVDTCKEHNVRILEAFMFRFHPQHKKVQDLIRTNALGKVHSFHGCYGLPPMSYDDIRHNKDLGGGILNDAACYPICASRIVFQDEPVSVTSYFDIDEKSQVETKVTMLMKYSKNRFASLFVGYDLYYQSTYVVWGNRGILKLNRSYNIPSDMNATMILNSSKTVTISIDPCNHYVFMLNAFCNEILGISYSDFDFEQDLLSQAKVMEAARLSAKEQCSISISEIK
ncbi:MAG: Gfo/Idh/MocA family oxidoreductase [Candidatus Nitrosotenuis sp.]